MKLTNHLRKAVSLLLAGLTALTVTAPAFAAQTEPYTDPAPGWVSANSRTDEFDINAVITHEAYYCSVCGKETQFTVYRVPEYTKSGVTARNHDVEYSDGTCLDGVSKGNLDAGTPGVDASYTGYHWCKAVCHTMKTPCVSGGKRYGICGNGEIKKSARFRGRFLHLCSKSFSTGISRADAMSSSASTLGDALAVSIF